MNSLRELARRLRMLMHRRQFDTDLEEEMRLHLELRQQQQIKCGMAPGDARAAARRGFGNVTSLKETSHRAWGWEWFEQLMQDISYGLRMLRKSPGFAAAAILTLALGIGANTAIFSLIDAVMLRLLPVERPEELAQVSMMTPKFGNGGPRPTYTNPLWEELRDHQDVFSGVFAWGNTGFNLAQGGVVQNVRGIYASGGYFAALGVPPAAGRFFSADDDKRGCAGVAVLSYGFWQEHFGGAISAIGSTITLEGHPFEIIGASAPGFFGTEVGSMFDVAAPICSEAILEGKNSSLDRRSNWWLRVMGRPKPGLSREQISARLAVLSPEIFAATVPANWNPGQQASFRNWQLVTLPGSTGLSQLRHAYDLPLKMLMGIAGLVLLIACANIANLMLARAAARRKEIAVRLALGASRLRLVRQLLTECVVLSVSGALVGILVAQWGSRLLVRYISTEHNKLFLDLGLDARVLAFTAGVAVLTGLLFGVLPAFRSTRVSLAGAMKGEVADVTGRDSFFRSGRWTVAVQMAISLVLVVTAGLFVRSFANLATLDAGFDRNNVLIVVMDMHNANLPSAERAAATDEILRRARALPDVINASQSMVTPLSGGTWDDMIVAEGPNAPTGNDSDVYINDIAPGYFATMRTPLLEGRDFNRRDTGEIPRVAIINQALARKFFPGIDPLGKTIRRYATAITLSEPIEIVGIARNAKYESLREDFPPTAYFPLAELPGGTEHSHLLIRTQMPPALMTRAVEQAVAGVNKSIALEFRTLAQQVNDSIVQERMLATLSGFFGTLALLLAIIGLYGVLAYLVVQRQKEIGIRMALGAQRAAIWRLVMRDVGLLLAAGVVVGTGMTWVSTRFIQGMLFGLQAHDAATIALAIGLLAGVGFLASYLPARRAMRVDPMVALRYE